VIRPGIHLVLSALFLAGAAVALGWMPSAPAHADSWALPKIETYVSTNDRFRLVVQPRDLRSQLSYFEDMVNEVEPAGQRRGGASEARARLERNDGQGNWSPVWEAALVNDVAPVSALVSDTGHFVVTFDNWHSVGHGDDVVVIYDREGGLVRSLALTDIVPESYVTALPHTVSSLYWAGEHRITDDRLTLQILVPTASGFPDDDARFVEAVLDLSTGRLHDLEGAEWQEALTVAAERNREMAAQAEAWRAARAADLTAPTSDRERDWHDYLREAFYRTAPNWEDSHPVVTVLRRPEAGDYAPSLGWLKERLTERGYSGGPLIFGSPAEENLVNVLAESAAVVPAGALEGRQVYIVADDAHWPRLLESFAVSGAELVRLDPQRPIPQRPERMPDAPPARPVDD
jgi:hypothetical protein